MKLAELKQRYFPDQNLSGDVWGGLAAMLVALPSAIAFGVTIFAPLGGSLAAQGALAGILGATVLGLLAPLLGGSTRLISAPCAPAAAVLSALAITFSQQGIPAETILLMLGLIGVLAGGIQIGLGMLGIGTLIKFIPFPVVSGYLSGVGLIIIGSQIPHVLGLPNGVRFAEVVEHLGESQWQPLFVAVVVVLSMLFSPRLIQKIPAAILALVAGVAAYLVLGVFDPALMRIEHNPLLVGAIGQGAFSDSFPHYAQALERLDFDHLMRVLLPALTLAVLLSIDTLKTCLVVDTMTGTHHSSNRELRGQGMANMVASVLGGIPGAGTMGASLINITSGGHSRVSGFMTGVFSLAALLLLAPLIAWVPVAALSAILMVVGFRMIDRHGLTFFFNPATRLDFIVILAVILVAIFGNLIMASGVGVALSILLFIREQTRSSVVRNRIEGAEVWHKHALLPQEPVRDNAKQAVIFELQGSLFFGTANQLQRALEKEIGEYKFVILSMRRVQSLDITATHVLEQIKDRLEECDGYLVFCDIPKGLPSGLKMKRFLKDTGVVRPTNKAFAFKKLDEALAWVMAQGEVAASMRALPALEMHALPVFAGHGSEALRALDAAIEIRTFHAGQIIFQAGDCDGELLIVRRGAIRVSVPVLGKEGYRLSVCGAGDFVGGAGFVGVSGHTADATALTEVEVYVLSRKRFDALAHLHPKLALSMVEHIAGDLSSRLQASLSDLRAMHSE